MSLKVQVDSHFRLLRVRCVWSVGDRGVDSIFYGVCVCVCGGLLCLETGGKTEEKKIKLQRFFVYR